MYPARPGFPRKARVACGRETASLHAADVLTVRELSKRFGSQVVLDRVNWSLPSRARVALVGANGAGKSTFLRILAGHIEPDSGSIHLPRGATVGYLEQEVFGLAGRTVLEEALSAFAETHTLERRCRELEEQLATTAPDVPGYADILEEYANVRELWDAYGSYDCEARAREVLAGLGFRAPDLERDCCEFSGGWQMRIALAKLLLRQPHLLLLDEPTNHLDLEARNWLEDFLRDYPHTVVLVAHDRYFMDQCCTTIAELSRGRLTEFFCNYSRYLVEREQRLQQILEAYREQQEEIERIQAFINRFRYQASKAALVQSRIKQLEKMERIEPPEGMRTLRFRFPQPERSGRVVLELHGIHKRYGDTVVYAGADLTIERGKKIGLVGPNGAGKSTLMRILAGVEVPDRGHRQVGHNVRISYFAQDRGANFDGEKSVLELVTAAAPLDLVPQVRSLLGAFLFSGDAVYKKAKVLSGGERSRLALAMLLLQPANCLLLDEPTNHLDLSAKEVLLEALRDYEGTLVFVAHDRYFLDQLADEILEVGDGRVTKYLGNYESYWEQKARNDGVRPIEVVAEAKGVKTLPPPSAKRSVSPQERRRLREQERLAREIEQLENEILSKEEELEQLRVTISAPDFYLSHPQPHAMYSEFAQRQRELERMYERLAQLERSALRRAS